MGERLESRAPSRRGLTPPSPKHFVKLDHRAKTRRDIIGCCFRRRNLTSATCPSRWRSCCRAWTWPASGHLCPGVGECGLSILLRPLDQTSSIPHAASFTLPVDRHRHHTDLRRRGYDVVAFATAGAMPAIGLEISDTAVRIDLHPV